MKTVGIEYLTDAHSSTDWVRKGGHVTSRPAARRASPLALAPLGAERPRSGGPTLPRVRIVHTAAFVAVTLGVSEDLVRLMAEELSDEDGCILVFGVTDEDCTPAFTEQGIDAVRELIAEFSQLDLPLTATNPRH